MVLLYVMIYLCFAVDSGADAPQTQNCQYLLLFVAPYIWMNVDLAAVVVGAGNKLHQ